MPTFSLLTFNCLGSPTSPTARQRLRALARELNARDSTSICLQEVQTHTYRRLLTDACTTYAAAAHAPFLHAPSGGLLTLSRLPIERWEFALYHVREITYPLSVMDWLLHKGVLYTQMICSGVPIVVLNTHLHANYSGNWSRKNRYTRSELAQLQQLAEIVVAQPPEALVVAAGDFNIPRGSWLYDEFLAATGMLDPLAGDMRPTYRRPPGIPARFGVPLDLALVRAPALPGLQIWSDLCLGDQQPLAGRRTGYLSDHVGIELRITWEALEDDRDNPPPDRKQR